jgi:hypothetical protein
MFWIFFSHSDTDQNLFPSLIKRFLIAISKLLPKIQQQFYIDFGDRSNLSGD